MDKFVHDGSEIDDCILADWLEDTHRFAEAEELREQIDSGQEEAIWCCEYVGSGSVGSVGSGSGGGVVGVGGVGSGSVVGGVGVGGGVGGGDGVGG